LLIKEKSFCALAVLVLALGICGVATIFSVIDAATLRTPSFPGADRIAGVQVIDKTAPPVISNFGGQIFRLDYEAMRENQQSFELLAAYISGATVNLTIDGSPQRQT